MAAEPFYHPAEAEFARILDFYGIPWEYEPRTFVLQRDDQGRVTEAFSPDFYLPDQDLYIELTTMQANQIRHKNRKLRRLRELYPEVNVKLFKRSDIRALLVKFGVEDVSGVLENDLEQTTENTEINRDDHEEAASEDVHSAGRRC